MRAVVGVTLQGNRFLLDKLETVTVPEDKKVKIPMHWCASCLNRQKGQNYCTFYSRHIEPYYNRCFNHSCYGTVSKKFRPLTKEQMDELLLKQELDLLI